MAEKKKTQKKKEGCFETYSYNFSLSSRNASLCGLKKCFHE